MNLALAFRQWRAVLNIYIQEGITYRAAAVIWILTDVSTAVTMPFVWIAASQNGAIQGYSANDFAAYYVSMLVVGSFVSSHFMWEVGFEIREGIFSSHLIRPMNYLQFILARNLAWRFIRTMMFVPFLAIFLWMFGYWLQGQTFYLGWQVWVMLVLGHLVSILFVTSLGFIAFYTEEIQSIFGLYYFPFLFLSGRIVPVDILPGWVRPIADWSPFAAQIDWPTRAAIGRLTEAEMARGIGIQAMWIVLSLLMYQVLWRKGLKRYTGVGM